MDRTIKHFVAVVVVAVGICLWQSWGYGADGLAPSPAVSAEPATTAPGATNPEAKQILRKCLDTYEQAKSWQTKQALQLSMEPAEAQPFGWKVILNGQIELTAKEPNKWRIKMTFGLPVVGSLNLALVSDGASLWTYVPTSGVATKQPIPPEFAAITSIAETALPALLSLLDSLTVLGREEVNGRPTHVVDLVFRNFPFPAPPRMEAPSESGQPSSPEGKQDPGVPVSSLKLTCRLWIDAEDYLLRQAQVKVMIPFPQMIRAQAKSSEEPSVSMTKIAFLLTSLEDKLNLDLLDSEFIFLAPEGVEIKELSKPEPAPAPPQ